MRHFQVLTVLTLLSCGGAYAQATSTQPAAPSAVSDSYGSAMSSLTQRDQPLAAFLMVERLAKSKQIPEQLVNQFEVFLGRDSSAVRAKALSSPSAPRTTNMKRVKGVRIDFFTNPPIHAHFQAKMPETPHQ
jgi:hypothetical protein